MKHHGVLGTLALSTALFTLHCGPAELEDSDGEDLGPYAERMPWSEFMATAAMGTVAGVAESSACTTAAVRGLSDQIVAQMNCLRPGLMGRIDDGNVSLGAAALPYLQTIAAESLKNAARGRAALSINSSLRTLPQQWILYQWYRTGRCGVALAALPGRSNHEDGLAVDTSSYDSWRAPLSERGFRWFGSGDRVHFDYVYRAGADAQGVKAFQRLWNRNNPADRISEDGAFGAQTEARLRKAPRQGFSGPQSCG